MDGDVSCLGKREAFLLTVVGDVEVGAQGEDPPAPSAFLAPGTYSVARP